MIKSDYPADRSGMRHGSMRAFSPGSSIPVIAVSASRIRPSKNEAESLNWPASIYILQSSSRGRLNKLD
jgi:hypothetical protein